MQTEIERLRNEVDRLWSRDVAQELKLSEAKYRALELVSNSLKYAFPDGRPCRIRISLKAVDKAAFVLVVGDDGIGLPEDVKPQNPKTLGLRLVYTLAQQLRGRVELTREEGTSFTILSEPS
jgi:two-component sensor histidine kinase